MPSAGLWAIRRSVPQDLIDTLSTAQRLALAYTPARAKPATLALFAFDVRLGTAIRQANEPIMGQMRLAWWRDQLSLAPENRERSDILVTLLDRFAGEEAALTAMVDGWELLLSDQVVAGTIAELAQGRAAGFGALARTLGAVRHGEPAARAGQRFALADLASRLSDPDERAAALEVAAGAGGGRLVLPRELRSIAVLDGLARRSLARGGAPLIEGPASGFAAIRLGLFGH